MIGIIYCMHPTRWQNIFRNWKFYQKYHIHLPNWFMIIRTDAMIVWRKSGRHATLTSGCFLDILDKTFGTEYSFIKEKHRCLDRSRDVLNKAKNIPNHMKERMKREMIMMYQKPVFRIEELMNDCDITHSTATKMVNLFIELKLVKQVNDKQRYRVYEYIPLTECIQRI